MKRFWRRRGVLEEEVVELVVRIGEVLEEGRFWRRKL